uniref:BPTI/Kunitz inhibitor domain-containing protein n=1 Tax=Elaeophora elaphi TaxID=1147741 RepID=A0A0R3RY28_9BILA
FDCITVNKSPTEEILTFIRKKVCTLPREIGNCRHKKSELSVTRFYFDIKTGTCRSFNYSGCGGNDNNFLTLDQCHGFCLAQYTCKEHKSKPFDANLIYSIHLLIGVTFVSEQCETGIAYRMDALNAACSPYMPNTCPKQFTCREPLFGPVSICCPNPGAHVDMLYHDDTRAMITDT